MGIRIVGGASSSHHAPRDGGYRFPREEQSIDLAWPAPHTPARGRQDRTLAVEEPRAEHSSHLEPATCGPPNRDSRWLSYWSLLRSSAFWSHCYFPRSRRLANPPGECGAAAISSSSPWRCTTTRRFTSSSHPAGSRLTG